MQKRISNETRFMGLPISGGVAFAPACLLNDRRGIVLPHYKAAGNGADDEKMRLNDAINIVAEKLGSLAIEVTERIGQIEAEIFVALKMMVEDEHLHSRLINAIETDGCTAEDAVLRTFEAYESRLLAVDNEYIKERVSDVTDLKLQLLGVLTNTNHAFKCEGLDHCQRGRNRIVVAPELTPTLTFDLDTSNTRGFVTERGGETSHAAILARALGIPAVCGIKGIHDAAVCGSEILVNGDTGEVIIWPSEETVAAFPSLREGIALVAKAANPVPGFQVMANINRSTDVAIAIEMNAEGIGLYRTEFEFIAADALLDEDAQYARYSETVKQMNGAPVYFRLLDVGGDKQLPGLNAIVEENPYLGLRGARLLASRPDLLATQARAIARASCHGPVGVMYPMIVGLEQFLELKQSFGSAIANLTCGELVHGVMFEVPSACLQAREILDKADFASIGTNDLTQYLFAVDRNNERVAYDYTPDKPVFWSLIRSIVEAAEDAKRPLSICGELASDPKYVPTLVDIGIKIVSVSARCIPDVRNAAAQHIAATKK